MHPFKKGQHILFSGVTKGRRGPLEYSNAKKCPTESRRIPSSATRTRSSRRNRYVFSSFNFVVFARVSLQNVFSIYSFRTHKKTFVSRVLLRESFSTAPSDSAFSHKRRKKREKNFSLFFCKSTPRRRFFDTSKFIRSADLFYSLPF